MIIIIFVIIITIIYLFIYSFLYLELQIGVTLVEPSWSHTGPCRVPSAVSLVKGVLDFSIRVAINVSLL